ncbi:uncharacterized protein LOC112157665 [Oryzias melastigma]|uniref:uncharacterized protein LOC112157665 n=1 Tax=Oryzias melastigma TaxID=30732 RepID=UPI000CF80DFF|nr:uncharacterized protein LOC112157665 [Oryzias melastigma]
MIGVAASRVWILVILTSASNGFLAQKALDPRRVYGSSPPSGSSQETAASGFARAESASSAASNPSFQSAPREPLKYVQPNARMGPVPVRYRPSNPAAPLQLGSEAGSPKVSSFQNPPSQVRWVVNPPRRTSGETPSSSSQSLTSELQPAGVSHKDPQSPMLTVQPGELSYMENVYNHGNYDLETEERLPPSRYFPVRLLRRIPMSSFLPFGPYVDGFWFGHPLVDHLLLNRRRPPGTYTFSSSGLEHGKKHWHDTHSVGDVPASIQQSQPFPQSEGIKQSAPRAHRVGKAGYGLSGEVAG